MKFEEFDFVFDNNGLVSVSHPEYYCWCKEVDRSDLRKDIHNLVDKLPDTVWTDGDSEEPATRVYLTMNPNGTPSFIEDLNSLIDKMNYTSHKIWAITVEDGLI